MKKIMMALLALMLISGCANNNSEVKQDENEVVEEIETKELPDYEGKEGYKLLSDASFVAYEDEYMKIEIKHIILNSEHLEDYIIAYTLTNKLDSKVALVEESSDHTSTYTDKDLLSAKESIDLEYAGKQNPEKKTEYFISCGFYDPDAFLFESYDEDDMQTIHASISTFASYISVLDGGKMQLYSE